MDRSQTPQPRPAGHRGPGRRARHRNLTLGVAAGAVLAATTATAGYASLAPPASPASSGGASAAPRAHGRTVDFSVHGGTVRVDTSSLRVTGRTDGGRTLPVSDAAADGLGSPGGITVDGSTASWSYPSEGLRVAAAAERGRLRMTVHADSDRTLAWPVTGKGPDTGTGAGAGTGTDTGDAGTGASRKASLQIPRGEGLDVPVADTFWNSEKAGLAGSEADLATGSLTLPLWGYASGGRGVSYLVPESVGTSLGFASSGGRLRATARHDFSGREKTRDYTVTFALTSGSPVAPAEDYRRWLDEHGQVRTLRQKIARNPEIRKLLGAEHAYLWGGARNEEAVRKLRKQGSTRLWLGYDADGKPMSERAVATAKQQGYLVGPYDSYDNGQDPATADTPVAKWPGTVYPDYCVRNRKGKIKTGFGGRGCYLSSQAFARSESSRHHLATHTKKMTANGVNSVFVDVDAAGELFSDFTPSHPMTKKQDRANRMDRMRALAERDGLVLGSESAVSWSAPVLAFNHGSQTPVNDGLWKLQNDKKTWGAYYPASAPGHFFKPVRLPAALAMSLYDPAYRVPLYQTALHDSLISTDRWEMPYGKLPEQKTDRALMSVLYNTPLNFALGDKNLEPAGKEMAALQRYFAPLHKAAGTERMTDFRRLTRDHSVQRSVFGNGALRVTANFGSKAYGSLPAGCVDARLKNEDRARRLCPANDIPGKSA